MDGARPSSSSASVFRVKLGMDWRRLSVTMQTRTKLLNRGIALWHAVHCGRRNRFARWPKPECARCLVCRDGRSSAASCDRLPVEGVDMIKELDQIVLTKDLPEYGLRAGDVGTVVL